MAQGIFLHEYNTGGKLYDGAVSSANNKLANRQYVIDNAALQSNNLSDLDNKSTARTNLGVAIGSDVQAFSARLGELAALSQSNGSFVVSDGSSFVFESGATARASLGLTIGTHVQAFDAQLSDVAGLTPSDGSFIVGDGSNFVAESGSTARASLGLTIGSDVQAYDVELAALAGLTSAANKLPMFSGSGTATVIDFLDEDDLSSNSATAVPSQQSVKAYVDGVRSGLDIKDSVRVASTAHIGASYNSSAKTLTASSAGVLTIDGVATALNDRILIKDQSTGSNNGIYKVTTAGAAGSGTSPNTSSVFTSGDNTYPGFVSTNLNTSNFDNSSGFSASTTSLSWSSYSGASYTLEARSIVVIKTYGGNIGFRTGPSDVSLSNGSSATVSLDGRGTYSSYTTTTSISGGTYITGIDVYEPSSTAFDDLLNGTINQSTTSISLNGQWSESTTLSAPFYLEVKDGSSNAWYWKITADVSQFANTVTVEFDEDDSHNATPSFNLGSSVGSAHSAGTIRLYNSQSGGTPVAAVLTRATDFDSSSEITAGAFCFVEEGTANGDAGFVLTTNDDITLDSTAMTFTQFSGAGQITAGTGLVKSGNTISATGGLADIAGLAKTDGGIIVGDGSNFVLESGSTARASLGAQASNARLDDISGLAVTDGGIIVGDGSNFVLESGSTARTSLGAQASHARLDDISGLAVTDGGIIVGDGSNFVLESGATARASLGVAIGSDVQAYDAQLDTLSGFTAAQVTRGIADDNLLTVDDADAADNDYAKFTANGIEGRSFSEVRTDLGLVIGTDVQAYDAQLDTLSGFTAAQVTRGIADDNLITADCASHAIASGDFARFTANGVEGREASQVRSDLSLVPGTDVQAYDAELAAIAGLTSAADKGIMFNGSASATTFDLTAAGRALLDDADAAAMRSTLGLVIGTDVAAADSTELSVTTSEPSSIAIGDVGGMFVYDLSGSSSHTVSLPSTATSGCLGKSIIFKVKSTVNSQTLTINPASNQTIEGESSIVLNQERQSIRLVISEEYSSGSGVQCWVAV